MKGTGCYQFFMTRLDNFSKESFTENNYITFHISFQWQDFDGSYW